MDLTTIPDDRNIEIFYLAVPEINVVTITKPITSNDKRPLSSSSLVPTEGVCHENGYIILAPDIGKGPELYCT